MRASRKFAASALAGTLLVAALGVAGASADTVDVTFTIENNGGLAVNSAAGTIDFGTVDTALDDAVSSALPQVTISDATNPFLGGWTVSVAATSFSDGGTETITGDNVSYWSGAATPAVGSVVVPVGQQLLEAAAVTLDAGRDAVVATGATGNNSATFTPSISVDLTGAQPGTYTGQIVHSVTAS